jgi:hypothetical protein
MFLSVLKSVKLFKLTCMPGVSGLLIFFNISINSMCSLVILVHRCISSRNGSEILHLLIMPRLDY